MAVKTTLPTTNLTWDDVRDTLNSGGGSVNNSVASAFKTAANINMWSKHKPVILNNDFCQDFDSSRPNYIQKWWQGADGKCGLSFTVYNPNLISGTTSFSDFEDVYSSPTFGYVYNIPTEKLRLGDFAAYYRDAKFESKQFAPTSETGFKPNSPIRISVSGDIEDDYHNLSIKDFRGFEEWFTGLLIYYRNGVYGNIFQGRTTVETPVQESDTAGGYIYLPEGFRDTGTYRCYPIVSQTKVYGEINKDDESNFIIYPHEFFDIEISATAGTRVTGQTGIYRTKGEAVVEIRLIAGDEQSVYNFSQIEFSIIKKDGTSANVTLFSQSISESYQVNAGETEIITKTYTSLGSYPWSYYEELISKDTCYMKVSAWDGYKLISFEDRSVYIAIEE